jgi:cytochrome d ubiquinol oxidase subunit I
MGFGLLTVLVPLQIVLGDLHGLNTLEYQPEKIAAIEANWETRARMPLLLFAWPDERAETNRFEVAVPALGSVILRHDAGAVVQGLKDWPRDQRPPVALPFFAFRAMVGIGLIMLAMIACSWWLRWQGRLYAAAWFQRLCVYSSPIGFFAVIAGWVTTEVGRQPWVVHGLLRTREAVSPTLTGGDVAWSLAVYVAAYLVIFGSGIIFMLRLLKAGPAAAAQAAAASPEGRASRPLSAAAERR